MMLWDPYVVSDQGDKYTCHSVLPSHSKARITCSFGNNSEHAAPLPVVFILELCSISGKRIAFIHFFFFNSRKLLLVSVAIFSPPVAIVGVKVSFFPALGDSALFGLGRVETLPAGERARQRSCLVDDRGVARFCSRMDQLSPSESGRKKFLGSRNSCAASEARVWSGVTELKKSSVYSKFGLKMTEITRELMTCQL